MYLFDNELFAIECIAKYAMEGRVVDSRNGQFAHCPVPSSQGDWGYYLTFNDHQHQGLLQSKDRGRKCYWTGHVKAWLNTWPPGCFDLWDIYDEFNKLSEETKERMSVTKSGRTLTEEHRKKLSEAKSGGNCYLVGRTGASHHTSKAIIVIQPDGTKLHFGSICEAARELETHRTNLGRYARLGEQLKQGNFKDWQFFFAE